MFRKLKKMEDDIRDLRYKVFDLQGKVNEQGRELDIIYNGNVIAELSNKYNLKIEFKFDKYWNEYLGIHGEDIELGRIDNGRINRKELEKEIKLYLYDKEDNTKTQRDIADDLLHNSRIIREKLRDELKERKDG